jgi:hypothetical protein
MREDFSSKPINANCDPRFRNTRFGDADVVCYIGRSMKKLARAMGSRLMSSALAGVILSALCFSVGEGLRLTPFPVSTSTQTVDFSLTSKSGKSSLSKYGPLDVPSQNQKRSKRQGLDLAGPVVADARYFSPEWSDSSEHDSVNAPVFMFVARPSGRAPPFLF